MKLGWLGGAALAAVTTLGGAAAGCGPAARDVDGPQARRAAWKLRMDTADFHYLVWRGTVADGETMWLDVDGKERARARGIVIAHRGRLWRLRPTTDLRPASGCNEDGSWDPAAQIEVRGAELFSGHETYPLVDYYGESYGVRGGETTMTLQGQLGRVMFVTEDEQLEGCDGVPRRRAAGFTYDLYREDMYDALIDDESEEAQRRAAGRQSDMSHYLPDAECRRRDRHALGALVTGDPDALIDEVVAHDVSMCGVRPAAAMLAYARAVGALAPRLVGYATSGDAFGDRDRVVGYAGVVIPAA